MVRAILGQVEDVKVTVDKMLVDVEKVRVAPMVQVNNCLVEDTKASTMVKVNNGLMEYAHSSLRVQNSRTPLGS